MNLRFVTLSAVLITALAAPSLQASTIAPPGMVAYFPNYNQGLHSATNPNVQTHNRRLDYPQQGVVSSRATGGTYCNAESIECAADRATCGLVNGPPSTRVRIKCYNRFGNAANAQWNMNMVY
jgi:hypothetical protein